MSEALASFLILAPFVAMGGIAFLLVVMSD